MTNNHFSRRRFCAYLKKLLVERRHNIVVSVLALLGIMLIGEAWTTLACYGTSLNCTDFVGYPEYITDRLFFEATLLFLIGGCVAAAQQFSDGQQKAGRIGVLTMPVSTLESWLARWLVYVPGYAVVFLVCFYLAELLRVAAITLIRPDWAVEVVNVFAPSDVGNGSYLLMWAFYLFVTSWYVLGCYFFPKRPLLSTTISMFVLGMAFVLLLSIETTWLDGFGGASKAAMRQAAIGWMLFHTACNWWLSYHRLKDMEVTDHN